LPCEPASWPEELDEEPQEESHGQVKRPNKLMTSEMEMVIKVTFQVQVWSRAAKYSSKAKLSFMKSCAPPRDQAVSHFFVQIVGLANP
jgi:hypothetical protein